MRPGSSADAIDGVIPANVAEPASAEELGGILAAASRESRSVIARGAGTKSGWGPPPAKIDILLSTSALKNVVAHRHGDLTATVQAGASLASVNAVLAQHRQWIPLDGSWTDRATIGGLVATNHSGPRRHRYGAPRDLIIGVEFARADGQLAKGGGIVVKNVAGYDLPRLMTGAFGSLAVITAATFKLYPIPPASETLVVDLKTPRELTSLALKIAGSQLTPTSLEFQTQPLRLLIRFETIASAVKQQADATAALLAGDGFTANQISGVDEQHLWRQHDQRVLTDDTLLKITLLPSELGTALEKLASLAGTEAHMAWGSAGLGVFMARLSGSVVAQCRVVEGLRQSFPAGRGSAVIVRGSAELRTRAGVWGSIGDGLALMKAVKQRFDPANILNPGRGPGGI
jgi:glycolate oxidase FAD binding subunit